MTKKKSILVDPKQISLVSKSEKEKKISAPPPPVMPLGPFDILACTTLFKCVCVWGGGGYKQYSKGGGLSAVADTSDS